MGEKATWRREEESLHRDEIKIQHCEKCSHVTGVRCLHGDSLLIFIPQPVWLLSSQRMLNTACFRKVNSLSL